MIRFTNVDLGYEGKTVLSGVSCDMNAGDYIGIVGPNGSGKSTFLRGLVGLVQPRHGTIEMERRLRFAYVPQTDDLNLNWPLNVRQVVSLPARAARMGGRLSPDGAEAIDEALARTGIADLAARRSSGLSGGQRQRAILAQALSQRPEVLLLDEPTQGLDPAVEHQFLTLVSDLRRSTGLTVLMVTHALTIPLNYADKILLFKDGRVFGATPDELVDTDRLKDIFGIRFLHHRSGGARWAIPEGTGQ